METKKQTAPIGTLTGLIDSFLRHVRAMNRSPKTLETYREACSKFARFVLDNRLPTQADELRREHVEAFIDDLLQRFKPSTAANRYRSLQQFFKWLTEEGEIPANPMLKMRPPTVPEPFTPVLSDESIRALLKVCSGGDFDSRRDAAISRFGRTLCSRMPWTDRWLLSLNGAKLSARSARAPRSGRAGRKLKFPCLTHAKSLLRDAIDGERQFHVRPKLGAKRTDHRRD
jgi:site-specific recombinase XerC